MISIEKQLFFTAYIKVIAFKEATEMKNKLFFWTLFLVMMLCVVGCSSTGYQKHAENLLIAIQKGDFETVFDMSHYYQDKISHIENQYPKTLWQEKSTEYYESREKAFYSETFMAVMGFISDEPTHDLRQLRELISNSSGWDILEARKEKEALLLSTRDVYVVYVKFDDETIVGLRFHAKTGLYLGNKRLD